MTQGSHPPWLEVVRTRKALTLVCRSWSAMSTPVLYGEVVFRRMGQICALADTLMLEGRGPYLSQLIRSIRLDGCVVLIPCAAAVRDDLGLILNRCTNLQAFAYQPLLSGHFPQAHWEALDASENVTEPERRPVGIIPTWFLNTRPESVGAALIRRLATGLTTLSIDIPVYDFPSPDSPEPICSGLLPHARHLKTLVLSGCMMNLLYDSDTQSLPTLHLPSLTTLTVHLNAPFCDYLCRQWKMPRLSALSITEIGRDVDQWDDSDLRMLFQTHGAALKYLSAPNGYRNRFRHLNEVLPVIEHLVMAESIIRDMPDRNRVITLRSPTLRFLDLWSAWSTRAACVGNYVVANGADVPALELIRLVSCPVKWLGPDLCPPELPLAHKPSESGPGPSIYFRLLKPESGSHEFAEEERDLAETRMEWSEDAVVHAPLRQTGILQQWWGICNATDYFVGEIPADAEEDEDAQSEYVYESPSTSDEDEYEDDSDEDSGMEELRQWCRSPGDWMLRDMGPYDHDTIVAMFREGQGRDILLDDSDDEPELSSDVSL